ncbi:cytochrome c biogenesis protein ResB [Streptomyces sp. NBC_01020]|uniref:cytochrome c biogenesis protein ResB n=1 Tax=unclassified Streptomyces TaxID=2593676 RepID=UPI003246E0A9|nr:cytochrome c biogenesis protein ResB [Streptomyces sp. NBC_01020]WSX68047.1 cytochrome c biogenesis protein ResB [Streptomyces sp. NBC_00932]
MSKTTETTDATNPEAENPEGAPPEEAADTAGSDTAESENDLGAAGSQLSTAPREEPVSSLPAMGVIGWIRWFWRQLTSMRVALLLLLLLSLGAIPGSLIPQTSIDALKVTDFKAKHDVLAPIYDKLGLFHVYSSVWFSAIYILLFISLIGCIVPRTWQFVGQLRGRPPAAPKRLTRLPAYTTWRTESEPEAVRDAALAMMKKRRFRAHITGDAVASEKGFLRETGNLLFHIALIVLLVSFASGQLWKSQGGKLVVDGDGFSNTLTQYDDFTAGTLFDPDNLKPFSFTLDKFVGTYEKNGPNRGTPRKYEAQVTYSDGANGKDKKGVIKVNTPLEIEGSKVYLVSHGYAPVVAVKDAKGKEIYRDAVPLLPLDSNATSTGAIKVMDGYRNAAGKKEQLGFQTMFVPTYAGKGKGSMFSTFPGLDFPVMAVSGFHGDLGVDSGLPQSVYQLNSKHMTQYKDSKGNKLAKLLLPGETMKLPHGEGSIQFLGVKQWASFKISQQPGTDYALAGALAAIAGLAGSLFIQRRRVWVRAVRGEDGVTVVEMAGLGRSESAKLPEELADLAATLHSVAPSAPDSAASAETPEGAEK